MKLSGTVREAVDILRSYFSKVQITDKDEDLDRDPYTSASWDGNSFSSAATGTINWVTDFGLPEIPKMVWLCIEIRDSASAEGACFLALKAKVTTTNISFFAEPERAVNDAKRRTHGCVAVADNGTTYYSIVASGVNTMDIWIRVVAWVK